MSLRIPVTISVLLVTVMAAVSAWGYRAIPDSARVAVHWGIDGNPNGFMAKDRELWLMPALAAGISLLIVAIRYLEPRQRNLTASRKFYYVSWIAAICAMTVFHSAAVLSAGGIAVDMSLVVLVTISLLISVLGNFVGKSRATFFVGGVRLPWTLTSDLAWEKSNRLLGWIFVATGLLALVSGFLLGTPVGLAILAAGIISGIIAAGITAYIVWRHDPHRQTGDTPRE